MLDMVHVVCQNLKDEPSYSFLAANLLQGSHRLEKYLNMKGFLEKTLKMKHALKSTG